MHFSIDTRGVQIVALRTNLFSGVRLHHQTSILSPQTLDNSLFHKHCLEASMIAVINLLNVNRSQYHQVGRLNHSPCITTGVKLSLTAATRRLFFSFFETSARDIKITGRVHGKTPLIRTLKGP